MLPIGIDVFDGQTRPDSDERMAGLVDADKPVLGRVDLSAHDPYGVQHIAGAHGATERPSHAPSLPAALSDVSRRQPSTCARRCVQSRQVGSGWQVMPDDSAKVVDCRIGDFDVTVQATGTLESRVDPLRKIRRGDDDNSGPRVRAVQKCEP